MRKKYGRTYRIRKKKLETALDKSNYELLKWMSAKGYKSSKKLKPYLFSDSGRGLMTKEVIKPGDVLISIPFNLLITPSYVLGTDLGPYIKRYCPNSTGQEILSIFLMCEYKKSFFSEWHLYIQSLPKMFNIPLFFSQHVSQILPKYLLEEVEKQYSHVHSSFLRMASLFDELAKKFKDCKIFSFELYKWAWSCVNTRCVYMKCLSSSCSGASCTFHLALAPFLDLLNHSCNVQVNAGFNEMNNQYEITSHNHFRKYSQVFINYGCHDNYKLFLEYGFIIPNNNYDCIPFSLEDFTTAYNLCNLPPHNLQRKLKFILDNQLIRNAVCSNEGLNWNMTAIIGVLLCDDMKYWSSYLHSNNQSMDNLKFQKFKNTLLNKKIDEYNIQYDPCTNCSSNCMHHQKLVLDLLYNEICILKKLL